MKNTLKRFTLWALLLILAGTTVGFTGLGAEDWLMKNVEDINQLRTRIDSLSAEFQKLQSEITKLKELLDQVDQEITEVETNIGPTTEKIGTLERNFQGKLRDLTARIRELERDDKAETVEINKENWMISDSSEASIYKFIDLLVFRKSSSVLPIYSRVCARDWCLNLYWCRSTDRPCFSNN